MERERARERLAGWEEEDVNEQVDPETTTNTTSSNKKTNREKLTDDVRGVAWFGIYRVRVKSIGNSFVQTNNEAHPEKKNEKK